MAKLNHYFPELIKASLVHFGQRFQEYKRQEVANVMWALMKFR